MHHEPNKECSRLEQAEITGPNQPIYQPSVLEACTIESLQRDSSAQRLANRPEGDPDFPRGGNRR